MSVRLVVTYADHQHGYFDVPEGQGWRIDAAVRCIVIGRGVPRKMVPLDGVQVIEVTVVEPQPLPNGTPTFDYLPPLGAAAMVPLVLTQALVNNGVDLPEGYRYLATDHEAELLVSRGWARRVDDGLPWVLDDPDQAEDPRSPLNFVRDVRIGHGTHGDLLVHKGENYTCFTNDARESLLHHGYAEEP